MVDFIHAHEPGGQLEHIVSEGDDDKLSILGALFDITCYDRDL